MRWFWKLRRQWRHGEEDARAEVEQSRQNLIETRKEVVNPLRHWQDQNHFATLIKDSLQLKSEHHNA